MAQFVVGCDEGLRPFDEVLVVDREDTLVAVGQAMMVAEEMRDFRKGMAVKVREGVQSKPTPA
jgi:7-cyano-7-deazaguanine tRNA-ribosyltransferase